MNITDQTTPTEKRVPLLIVHLVNSIVFLYLSLGAVLVLVTVGTLLITMGSSHPISDFSALASPRGLYGYVLKMIALVCMWYFSIMLLRADKNVLLSMVAGLAVPAYMLIMVLV